MTKKEKEKKEKLKSQVPSVCHLYCEFAPKAQASEFS